MREPLQVLARCLIGGGCAVVLLCTSCRHSPSSRVEVRTAAHTPADQGKHGIYHEVKPGQTLWSIAQAYGVDMHTLAKANALTNITALYVGQKLYIPGAVHQREVASRCPCGTDPPKPAGNLKPLAHSLRPAERSPAPQSVSQLTSLPKIGALAGLSMIWPVHGEVTRGFSQEAAQRHDGIDIMAPEGTLILAAADGEVLFSDWGPGGYGRLVILQHQAEVVTIYAHNHTNLVRPGQRVRQGDPIATVGQSGRTTGTHLHFEVRYKATPIDPHKLLPRRPNNIAALDRG